MAACPRHIKLRQDRSARLGQKVRATMAATAVNDREPKDKEPKPPENPRAEAVRKAVWEKVKDVPNRVKVDIKRVFKNRYRVNTWAETGKESEGGFFKEKLIVQSFIYIDEGDPVNAS